MIERLCAIALRKMFREVGIFRKDSYRALLITHLTTAQLVGHRLQVR
jgi:hypothetical protein